MGNLRNAQREEDAKLNKRKSLSMPTGDGFIRQMDIRTAMRETHGTPAPAQTQTHVQETALLTVFHSRTGTLPTVSTLPAEIHSSLDSLPMANTAPTSAQEPT